MHDKRLTIINEATALFSEKGFHATSMQEVADQSHVSKGTIYTYFASKEDLLLSIFKFFHENILDHLRQSIASNLSMKEKYKQQIYILLSESLKYKAFFKMQHREQLISSHKTIQNYLIESRLEQFEWYRNILSDVYGQAIQPYLAESTILLDALVMGFLRITMLREDLIDLEEASLYITKRLDDMVQGIMNEASAPLFSNTLFEQFRSSFLKINLETETDIQEILARMEQQLKQLNLEPEKKKELENSLQFFKDQFVQDPSKKFLFKGLLSNFEGVEELEAFRKRLESLLQL